MFPLHYFTLLIASLTFNLSFELLLSDYKSCVSNSICVINNFRVKCRGHTRYIGEAANAMASRRYS